jgi:5-methylcytosine-specific restriction endonuclease McrA
MKLLSRFRSVMKPYRLLNRSSTVSNAFAQALAPADDYDEARLETAFRGLGLVDDGVLLCVYCSQPASSVDHLNSLVKDRKFTGWGHVFGNLVPACGDCNQSKGGRPWREFARDSGVSETQIRKIEKFERQSPTPVSQDDLSKLYPDLIDAYERLRNLNEDTLRTAQSLANEIQRLEKKRKKETGPHR